MDCLSCVRNVIICGVALGFAAAATHAGAQPLRPRSSAGFASIDTVHEAVGIPHVDISCPDQRVEDMGEQLSPTGPHMGRGAKVTLDKAGEGYRDTSVTDTLLLGGLMAAIQQCPMQQTNIAGQASELDSVGFVDIYGRLTDDGPVVRLVHADDFFPSMSMWSHVTDEGVGLERAAAAKAVQDQQAAAPRAAGQPAAQSQPPVAIASPAAPQTVQPVNSSNPIGDFFNAIGNCILVVLLAGIALWGFVRRNDILRFWYGLTPHPATALINEVISAGRKPNSERLKRALEIAPANPVEREVRMRQAAELHHRLRRHAEKTKSEIMQEAAYIDSQAGLIEGVDTATNINNQLDAILRHQGNQA